MEPRSRNPVADSYPTFWDAPPQPPATDPVRPDEAYSTFVTLTEDEFPRAEPVANRDND